MSIRTSAVLSALLLCFVLTDGRRVEAALTGHYPLDEITGGTTTLDTTGVNGPGTLNGGVTLSPGAGKIGGAFSFSNSSGNFVGIQDAGFGQTAFTASVWFQPTVIDAGLGGMAGDVVDLGGGDFFLNLDGTAGVSTLSAAVPEPSTFALAALGLLGLAWFGRRRKR